MWALPSEQHTGPWRQTSHITRPDTRPIEAQPKRRKISLQNRGHPHTPRVYRRAKLSENCPLWDRIERRPQSRIRLSSAHARYGLLRSIVTNIEAMRQRMLRSQE